MRDLRQEEVKYLLTLAENKGKLKLKSAIYARKSREDETQTSLMTQIDDCQKFIEKYNYILEGEDSLIFQESNVSGFFIERRDEFSKLMDLVRSKKIDVIITMKIDRFSRFSTNTSNLIDEILSLGGYFIAGDDLGDNSAAGILIKQIMWATNEFVSRRSVEDSMKVKAKLTRDGYSVGGVGNYGYKIVDRKFLIEPLEAIVVNLIFDLVLDGYSYEQIIDELESRGFQSRSGHKFTLSTIHGILNNERNCGIHIWNSNRKRKDKKRVLKENFGEIISKDAVPEPIISEEKFYKVQEILKDRSIPKAVDTASEPYLLTGLIKCSVCGGNMTGYSKIAGKSKTRMRYYVCPRHANKTGSKCATKDINASHLETALLGMIKVKIEDHIKYHGISEVSINKFLKDDLNTLKRLKRELNHYQEKVEKLIIGLDLVSSDTVKKSTLLHIDEYGVLIDKTNDMIATLNNRIDHSHRLLLPRSNTGSSTDSTTLTEWFGNHRLTRRLITSLINEINVSNDSVIIDFKEI